MIRQNASAALPSGQIFTFDQSSHFCGTHPGADLMTSKTEKLLAEIAEEIRNDKTCPLRKTRTNAVPGEGSAKALVAFIGEAPGQEEDEQGRPFVGRSGQLLRRTIEEVGFKE